MNTVKYLLVQIETLILLISFIIGIGAIEVNSFGWGCFLLFSPIVWGYFTNFSHRIHFCEVYLRALRISNK